MPQWVWLAAWAVWAAIPAAVMGLSREEFDADARRKEGGTIYQDIVWEIKGEEERALRGLLDLMIALKDTAHKERVSDVIMAQHRNIERLNRLLRFKKGQ